MSRLLNSAVESDGSINSGHSPSKAWLRALELTASIAKIPARILPAVIEDAAGRFTDQAAVPSERECFSYRTRAERSNRYARWALYVGLAKGDVSFVRLESAII